MDTIPDIETKNLYDQTAFGMRLAVVPSGSFVKEGQTIEYDRGIKISGHNSKYNKVKLTALQVIALSQMMADADFQNSIAAWAIEEKKAYEKELSMLK